MSEPLSKERIEEIREWAKTGLGFGPFAGYPLDFVRELLAALSVLEGEKDQAVRELATMRDLGFVRGSERPDEIELRSQRDAAEAELETLRAKSERYRIALEKAHPMISPSDHKAVRIIAAALSSDGGAT